MKLKMKDYFYCMGSFSGGILGQVFSIWIYFFYVDTLKFDNAAIASAMTIYALWNAINDPLFGFISDKTRSRWGRRIPYIIFLTIPMVLAFMMIWMPPLELLKTDFSRMAYFLISICLYDTFFTIVFLNWTALFPEMYVREEDRNRVSGLRQILGVLGAIVASVAAQPFFNAFGWTAMGIVFGIISGITMYMSLLGSKEKPFKAEKNPIGLIASFKSTLINYSFLTFVFSNTFVEVVKIIVMGSIPFFSKYVLKSEGIQPIMMGIIFISSIIFIPVWVKISNKMGGRNTFILSLVSFGVTLFFFFIVNSVTTALIAAVTIGFGLGGLLMIPDVLMSQVIDEDEVKTGLRREGAYFGVNAFILRFSVAIQVNVMAYVQRLTKYDNTLSVELQPESAITGIRLLMSIIPIVFILFAIFFAVLYPLHGERLRKIKDRAIEIEA